MLSSLEGQRGQPKLKPPFPAAEGLYRRPTVINNVETLFNVPFIVTHGADWYRQWGTPRSPGLKLFCVSGHVERPGTYRLERLGCVFRFQELEGPRHFIRPPSANTAFFDAEKIDFPLVIRNVRPGDRFVPHGMTGRKKLKDFFIDRKIPKEMRSRLPLLVQGEAVLWVCGHRTDDRFRVHPETRLILRVDLMEQVEGINKAGSRMK